MARILVVDDEIQICVVLTEILKQQGHEVFSATSGKSAIEALPSFSPELVLVDLLMPDMDGMAVLEAVKSREGSIPVIVLSGVEDGETAQRAIVGGATDYLTKPIRADQLETVLDVHLLMQDH